MSCSFAYIKLFLAFSLALGQPCGSPFLVTNYGAVGDGVTDGTIAIQAALVAAGSCPLGGLVRVPYLGVNASSFLISSIFLESNVELNIETGATLLATTNFSAYPTIAKPSGFGFIGTAGVVNGARCTVVPAPGDPCYKWEKLTNVSLTGGGTIDGQGWAWWWASTWWPGNNLPRPFLLELHYIDGLVISGLTLRQSALWTIVPSLSTNILIEYITLDAGMDLSAAPYDGYNVDGLDSNNVQNMTMRHSILRAGDDCVAINSRSMNVSLGDFPTVNVTIGPNVTCYTPISLGSGTGLGLYNTTIRDSVVVGTWGWNTTNLWLPKWYKTAIRLKTQRTRGPAGIHGVDIINVTGVGVDLMLDFQMYYSCQNSSGMDNYYLCRNLTQGSPESPSVAPSYSGIHVNGLYGTAWRAAWLNCLPENPCQDVTFDNVNLQTTEEGWVCENVHGSATARVSPPPTDCFTSG